MARDLAERNRVRERWARGECAVGAWMHIPSIIVADTLAAAGFDAIVIDLQHSAIDFGVAVQLIIAIEGRGAEPFVRLAALDTAMIGKLLDAGATGIIAPYVENATEAKALASACRYPPRGRRSYGPRRPPLRYGNDYVTIADETIVTLAMIETAPGIAAMTEIMTTDGIDGVFIGPSDLSLSLAGTPAAWRTSSDVIGSIDKIREVAHKVGSRAGIFGADTSSALARRDEGFDLVTVTPDLAMVAAMARDAAAAFRA